MLFEDRVSKRNHHKKLSMVYLVYIVNMEASQEGKCPFHPPPPPLSKSSECFRKKKQALEMFVFLVIKNGVEAENITASDPKKLSTDSPPNIGAYLLVHGDLLRR